MTADTITAGPEQVTASPDRDLVGEWDAARAADYCARRAMERPGGCTCRDCISVDHLPSARLREASPLAEYVARRIEVLG